MYVQLYMYIPSLNIMTQSLALHPLCCENILKTDWLSAMQLMQR